MEVGTTGRYAGFIVSQHRHQRGRASGPYEPGVTAEPERPGPRHPDHRRRWCGPGVVTLFEPGSLLNPSSTAGTKRDANFTVDFGLFQPLARPATSVWNDEDNDGTFDAGEFGHRPGCGWSW